MARFNSPLRPIFTLILLCLVSGALASGWPQPKGKGFVKLGQWFLLADQYFDSEGNRTSITTSGFFSTHLYAEYGVLNNFTVGAYVPFVFHSYVNGMRFTSGRPDMPGMEATDFGDVDVFFQYGLIRNSPFVLSAVLLLGIPTGNSEGLLTSGDGEFNQMVRLDAGYAFSRLPIFLQLSSGFNNRTNNFADEIRINAEVGYTFSEKYIFILKSLNTRSLQNGDASVVQGGIFSNDLDYSVLGPELLIKDLIGKVGVTANYYWTLSGRNIVANDTFTVGLFMDF